MFQLISNMSNEVISSHRSLDAAKKAASRFQKGSSPDSFRPWRIEKDGEIIARYGQFESSGYEDGGW